MQNGLIDNSKPSLQMVGRLRELIADVKCQEIRIATGYWDLPGTNLLYEELKAFLERGGTLKILIGQEPTLLPYQRCDLPEGEKFPDFYIAQDLEKLTDEYKDVGQLLVDYMDFEDDKDAHVQVHVYGKDEKAKDQFLHAKSYILTGDDFAFAFVGSSNFTQKGLEGNAELNTLETNAIMVTAAPNPSQPNAKSNLSWFNEKWENSRPWNGKFISMLKAVPLGQKLHAKQSPVCQTVSLTPYEVYIKLLQYRFKDVLDASVGAEIKASLPPSYMPLEYQIDAVKQCCAIMHEHGGFMLGDVVGLGKTIVGTLIVRRFLDDPGERLRKVLIVTPPAVKSAWERTIAEFDDGKGDKIAANVDFITTGSIDKLISDDDILDVNAEADDDSADTGDFDGDLKHENYGLILIDESHKFRNATTVMYKALDSLIAEIGMSGHGYPYVGLLSATPQNNAPNDLKNQIYLFQRDRKCTTLENVPGKDLEAFFGQVCKEYNDLRKALKDIVSHPDEHTPGDREAIKVALQNLSVKVRDCVLCDLLVRRTRTDVKLHYAGDMSAQGIVFPAISGPHEIKYVMDGTLATLFHDTMNLLAPSDEFKASNPGEYLSYWRYQAVRFLKADEDREKYRFKNLDVERFCRQLAMMTQMNLVKRLESSFSAFKASLRNLRDNTGIMIKMWENDTVFICPQLDVNAELDVMKLKKKGKGGILTFAQCCADIRAKIQQLDADGRNDKGRNHEYRCSDFASVAGKTYIEWLQNDYALLNDLCDRWNSISYDPKLEVFKSQLNPVLFAPATNTAQRLVVFTEALDTASTLKESAEHLGFAGKVLVVTAKNRKELEPVIRANFDANYEGEQKNDYCILITTEVLAEGVNLHRANCILNYDTPWNSTRLMQRIGRVNRIGSAAPCVYVYNFMPSAEGDRLIKLVETAYVKLQSFHTLFGEDSKVFTEDEELAHYSLGEMVDGEESIYEPFKTELKNYKAAHPKRYAQILECNENLFAADGTSGNRYFIVAAPSASGLPVRYNTSAGKGEIISYKDIFLESRPDESAASVPLPSDWNAASKAAIQAFGQHMTKINTHIRNSAEATAAKKVLIAIRDKFTPPDGSEFKGLIVQAYAAVENGNKDIINKVLKVAKEVAASDSQLIEMSAAEVEAVLKTHLEQVVANVGKKLGKPYIYLGISR